MSEIYRNDFMILKLNDDGRYILTSLTSDTIYTSGTREDIVDFCEKLVERYTGLWSDVSKFIVRTAEEMLDWLSAT